MKIVICKSIGGFSLSEDVFKELKIKWDGYGYLDNENFNIDNDYNSNQYRSNKQLISVIEKLGLKKSGYDCKLAIIEIPDNVEWYISEDFGECIHEEHRTWS